MGQSGGNGAGARRQRASTRWPIEVPVLVHGGSTSAQGRLSFDTKDVSITGAFLHANLLLEVDEELSLELQLDARRTVKAKAKVVRVSQSPPGMGITFTSLGERDRDALRALVQQKGIAGGK